MQRETPVQLKVQIHGKWCRENFCHEEHEAHEAHEEKNEKRT
jgi:hypothetical protein